VDIIEVEGSKMSGEVKGQRSLHMAKCLKELNAMIDTNSGNPNPKL
jgi:hypothetical protein